ncbi:hypothetical protein RND81_10G158600 [Saponaria officinalis]|uniref:Uncharacterized protein n=1 Tax=Saponaria officinalis TaxID=3572 RepID=A0AAW1I389_SAPOF
MMEISEKELEKRLLDAGNKLLSPPSSVAELLNSLDVVENLLSGVEQSPTESMKEALVPSTKALITDELLRHTDADVKVTVASCISEITRITAPEAPYADDEMKEVFQLIVSSFEKLDEKSSRSYAKRISILETVAKVRSCVVMLDLQCSELIVEMFRHFLRTIRDDHHEGVFSSMETVMALVVEESEDISVDLLSPMLDVLKKENKEVLPIACQLAENVITKCASKLKPYLLPALSSIGTSLDDYTKAVSDVYQARDEAVKPTDGDASNTNLAENNDLMNPSSEQADEVAMESLEDAPPSEEAGPVAVGSSKTVVGNGILQKGDEDSSAVNDNSLETDHDTQDEKGEPSKTSVDSLTAAEPPKSKKKTKKSNKRKGKKQKSSKSSSEPLQPVASNQETAAVDTHDHQDDSMDVDNLQSEEPAVDATDAANNEKSSDAPITSPKASHSECADVSPPSPSGSLADETRSKKAVQEKKKEAPVQEVETAHEVDEVETAHEEAEVETAHKDDAGQESDIKKDSEETTGSKSKLDKHTSKNSSSASDHEENVPDSVDDSKKEDDNIHGLDDNSVKDLAKETEVGRLPVTKKKRTPAKATPAKGNKKTPAKDERKAVALPKSTPKAAKGESDAKEVKSSNKRKRLSEEKTPKFKVYGKELVGLAVKVWWPDDNEYYEGVIESFDAVKKKHKVSYTDGDVEILNLKEEKWMVVNHSEGSASDGESPADSSDDMPLRTKIKTSGELGSKSGKTGSSAKKSGASSSKSKATLKSGSNDRKTTGNSKEESTKKVGKSDADKSGKSKVSKSGNKLSDDAPKSSKTSKDDDEDTIKGSSKSKQDTPPKTSAKSKGKSQKSGAKPNTSGSGKGKATTTSTKDEETEDESDEPARTPEKSKTKSQSASKSQQSSKKRKRS